MPAEGIAFFATGISYDINENTKTIVGQKSGWEVSWFWVWSYSVISGSENIFNLENMTIGITFRNYNLS